MKIGDKVRIVKIPPSLPEDDLQTRSLFEDCLNKIFRIAGFNEYGFIELHVGNVRQKSNCAKTIWVEPEFVEILSDVTNQPQRTHTAIQQVFAKYHCHPEFLGIEIVDPNQPGAVDDTLLHLTARHGALEDIQTLVTAGANVNVVGDLGNTPLHSAAMSGQTEAVKLLLKLGANLSLKRVQSSACRSCRARRT